MMCNNNVHVFIYSYECLYIIQSTYLSFGELSDGFLFDRNEFKQRFGITVAFLATHSGLTRWQEFHSNMAEEAGAG